MKVLVEIAKCQGYGNCVIAEPRVFDLDENGFVKLLVEEPSEDLRDQINDAVRECPRDALAIED
jgi:ferredoxin